MESYLIPHVPLRDVIPGAPLGSLTESLLHDALTHVGLIPYLVCLVSSSSIATFTLLITSDITPIGRYVYKLLLSSGHFFDKAIGFGLHALCFGVGAALLSIGMLLDIHRWRAEKAQVIYASTCAILMMFGLIFYTAEAPSMPLILGVTMSVLVLVAIRKSSLLDVSSEEFSVACAISFFSISFILTLLWIIWALSPALRGRHYASDISKFFNENVSLAAFILWASPMILAGAYCILGVFALVRARAHLNERGKAVDVETDKVYVAKELKFVILCLTIAVFFSWVAASVAAHDIGLSRTVLRLSFVLYFGVVVYVLCAIGPSRVMAVAEDQEVVRMVIDFGKSDWMKGLTLLLLWPMVPVYFSIEVIHQRVRNFLVSCGLLQFDFDDERVLTKEAKIQWERMQEWDWSSVLTKSIYAGMGYFLLQVGVSTGMTMFLSWLSETVAPWPLLAVLAVLFCVGISLFLLPPVPGLPIYLISGIVVVEKLNASLSFALSCFLATVFCFVIKLVANVILQKCIGEVFSDNLMVLQNVQAHTSTMKAVEFILSARGLDPAKVSVLVGGPDWPTAVMTGILRITIYDMLVGSIPCFFVILPVVLSAAFTLKAGQASAEPTDSRQGLYSALSSVMITLSAVVQMGSMLCAGLYIQAVKEENKEEFARIRDTDVPIIEAIAKSEQEYLDFQEKTAWSLQPLWLKGILFMGSVLSSLMMLIVLCIDAFHPFSITDSIGDPPLNGNAFNVILPAGWVAIASLSAACVCLCVHSIWCSIKIKGKAKGGGSAADEETPLLSKAAANKQE